MDEKLCGAMFMYIDLCKERGIKSILILELLNFLWILTSPLIFLFQIVALIASPNNTARKNNLGALKLDLQMTGFSLIGIFLILISKVKYTVTMGYFINYIYNKLTGETFMINDKPMTDDSFEEFLRL